MEPFQNNEREIQVLCYEDAKRNVEVPAVASCRGCGAGVCLDHLEERSVPSTTTNGVGAPTIRPDGRVLHCASCLTASARGH